jgi:hypothetical protein
MYVPLKLKPNVVSEISRGRAIECRSETEREKETRGKRSEEEKREREGAKVVNVEPPRTVEKVTDYRIPKVRQKGESILTSPEANRKSLQKENPCLLFPSVSIDTLLEGKASFR